MLAALTNSGLSPQEAVHAVSSTLACRLVV
jgi:hypothetical protein